MIIIVEGIDRVGKTTFCEKLSEQLGFPVFKHNNSFFPYEAMDNYNETDKMVQLVELASMTGSNIIFDRFHLSEFAYGVAKRKYESNKASKNFFEVDERLAESEAILVYVEPEDIVKSSEEHGEDLRFVELLIGSVFRLSKVSKISTRYSDFDNAIEAVRKKVLGGSEF